MCKPVTVKQLLETRCALLQLQEVVSKHNACFRSKFPPSHPVYKCVARAMFGVFDDIPMQIHTFAYAAEEIAYSYRHALPYHPSDLYTDGISKIIQTSRKWAPQHGTNWKKKLTHIEQNLAQEIGKQARRFFDCVYKLPNIKKISLQKEEATFWARYNRMLVAESHAEIDNNEIVLVLTRYLPIPLCKEIAQFL